MDINIILLQYWLHTWINIYNFINFYPQFPLSTSIAQFPLSTIFYFVISNFHIILPFNFYILISYHCFYG